MSAVKKKNTFNVLIFIVMVSAVIVYAHQDGIVQRTLKNGEGCTCHSDSPFSNVTVVISGPDTLAFGETGDYMVTIQGGPLVAGGTNIAASDGNLLPVGGDLRKESDELTHVTPKLQSAGKVTFEFTYTAPNTVGEQILFANGNSVNLNGENTGDEWNFASNKTVTIVQPTGINDEFNISSFELFQNYPNPFNPSTNIQYAIGGGQFVKLMVYDVLGNEITALVNEWKDAGQYSVNFNASGLPSGVYFYRMRAGNYVETKKMILLR